MESWKIMLLEEKTIMKTIRKNVAESFIASFLIFVFGLVLLRNPENFMATAIHIFGYGAFFFGVLDVVFYFRLPKEQRFFAKRLTIGIMLMTSGIVAFFEVNLLKEMTTILIGGYLLFQNANRLELSVYLHNYTKVLWKLLVGTCFLNIVGTLFLILNPFCEKFPANIYISVLLIVIEIIFLLQNVIILLGVRQHEASEEK